MHKIGSRYRDRAAVQGGGESASAAFLRRRRGLEGSLHCMVFKERGLNWFSFSCGGRGRDSTLFTCLLAALSLEPMPAAEGVPKLSRPNVAQYVQMRTGVSLDPEGLHSTEVACLLLTQQPWV